MSEIHRFSSRRQRLDHAFLANRLSRIVDVRIVCISEPGAADIVVSKHARETALTEKWKA